MNLQSVLTTEVPRSPSSSLARSQLWHTPSLSTSPTHPPLLSGLSSAIRSLGFVSIWYCLFLCLVSYYAPDEWGYLVFSSWFVSLKMIVPPSSTNSILVSFNCRIYFLLLLLSISVYVHIHHVFIDLSLDAWVVSIFYYI